MSVTDEEVLEESIWCGFRGEHMGHEYQDSNGQQSQCDGHQPKWRSRAEPDEVFEWPEEEDEYPN